MKQPSLVIVEDDVLFAQALTAFVEDLGYQVVATVETEQAASQLVREGHPDLVVMDINLAEGDGIGAALVIRESSQVPIIFCTSYADDGAIQLAVRSLGNTALVGKPFDEAELAGLLAKALKEKKKTC